MMALMIAGFVVFLFIVIVDKIHWTKDDSYEDYDRDDWGDKGHTM